MIKPHREHSNSLLPFHFDTLIKIYQLQPPIVCNYRIDYPNNPLFTAIASPSELKKLLQYFKSDGFVKQDPNRRLNNQGLLHRHELDYLKQQGNNVTLFIHGYNVPYGAYGREISSDNSQPPSPPSQWLTTSLDVALQYDEQAVTIYRDPANIIQHYPNSDSSQLAFDSDEINGTGAHNWWVHMEYNLNKAAGFMSLPQMISTEPFKYTRLISIAWQGNPRDMFDYIAAEPIAAITAEILVNLIKQLIKEGIQVNIISHSLGCALLVRTMNLLGDDKQYFESIRNAFLWQPAIPNNALSSDPKLDSSLQKNWATIHANKAAKNIHVFHSLHDNVLGPIPIIDNEKKACINEKVAVPNDGLVLAISALAIDVIDSSGIPNPVKSAYNMAHIFTYPIDALLVNKDLMRRCYSFWTHHFKANSLFGEFCETLDQQAKVFEQYPDKKIKNLFEDLIFAGTVYLTIFNSCWLYFFSAPQTLKSLKTIQKNLTLEEQNKLSRLIKISLNQNLSSDNLKQLSEQLNQFQGHYAKLSHYFDQILKKLFPEVFFDAPAESNVIQSPILNSALNVLIHLSEFGNNVLNPQGVLGNLLQIISQPTYLAFIFGDLFIHAIHANTFESAKCLATLLLCVFSTPNAMPTAAMGYSGPIFSNDKIDKRVQELQEQKRFTIVDQTPWLFHHSAMKIPSDDVMQKTYRENIIQTKDYRLGCYE